MRFRAVVGASILLLSTSAAMAQDALQKSEIIFRVRSAEGNPTVCDLAFKLVYLDRTYRNGALAAIVGTLGWVAQNNIIGIIFKTFGFDFPRTDTLDATPFSIPHAFLIANGTPYSVNKMYRCEQPEGFCGYYLPPASVDIYVAAFAGKLAIAFNRESQGLDVSLPLDPRGHSSKAQEAASFRHCMSLTLGAKATK
jgi:hypothetical protein